MEWLLQPQTWIAFLTLVVLELVLGVDNIIFISILAGKLPVEDQSRARTTGILLAVVTRLLLLFSLSWIINLKDPIFTVMGYTLSERDIVLLAGGIFLIWKATREIHEKLEGSEGHASAKVHASFWSVIVQIMLLDIVFSLDSVITAVGMVDELPIMIAAVIIAALVMIFLAAPLSNFVEGHPTIKMLALSFLLLIGFTLVVESLDVHIPKGYIYFAMGFSVMVETLNLRMRQRSEPVQLRSPYQASAPVPAMAEVSAPKTRSVKSIPKKKSTKKRK
ncbi:MAG: TerC family protein [Anaerolineae bacterium]|nr:TerC family protein [Anaerolineae bacterium]MBL8104075.1 TerC family protein [Anaerolineales bacterium]MCC7188373.1 TerC family protein [Anaerolineales bacterium]